MNTRLSLTFLFALFAPLAVRGADAPTFSRHVTPTLYRLGCSSGQCHGAFSGKGGFRLSLFAAEPNPDYPMVRGPLGRRVNLAEPEQSLFLLKPTGAVEHGGGLRLKVNSPEYRLLKAWIEAGARFDAEPEGRVQSIRVEPPVLVLQKDAAPQPLRVFARMHDGKENDVTHLARFESLDPAIAAVDADGRVTADRNGDAPILVHYASHISYAIALAPTTIPPGLRFPEEMPADKVDQLILAKLRRLNIVPSPVCSDEEFIRRVYLDAIGQLPLPEETRAFVADRTADKRARLIDKLLAHPLHAAMWATKLCDMTGVDDRFVGNSVYQFHDWYRHKFEHNVPWDRIVHGVLCSTAADGRLAEDLLAEQKRQAEERRLLKDPAALAARAAEMANPFSPEPWQTGYALRNTLDLFYNNRTAKYDMGDKRGLIDSQKMALRVSSAFLGVQIECAQCHKHPHDKWTQGDFFGFATVFAHVHFTSDPALEAKKIRVQGTHVRETPVETFEDPRSGQPVGARVLGGEDIDVKAGVDPREQVWKWMVSDKNPYFARAMVNRVWAMYFGRGLVNPIEAQASANPPSHPEVMDELVRDFIESSYDLRRLERRILNMSTYQRSWQTNPTNAKDERNFSHYVLRRLTAEQVVDAVAQVTGTPVQVARRYAEVRPNSRAVEIAASRGGGDDGFVLQIFGKPQRLQNCDCERSNSPSLSQVLYLYNDTRVNQRILDDNGRLKKLLNEFSDDARLIEELHLLTLCRRPTASEAERLTEHIKTAGSRLEGFQDVLWSLLNRDEFIVNH